MLPSRFERDLPRLPDAEQVRRVVERAEVVRRVQVVVVDVLVALQAVLVHHQRAAGMNLPSAVRASDGKK